MKKIGLYKPFGKIGVILLTLMITGCSTFGFFFDRLPLLSVWQFDRMFKLEEAQEQLVRNGTEHLTQWMREDGFVQLITELKESRELWNQELHLMTIRRMEKLFDDSSQRVLQAVTPDILPVLLALDENNAKNFRNFNQRRLRGWYEYADSDEAKLEFRIHQLSRWFGDLNDAQIQMVSQSVVLLPREREIRIENNQVWTEKLLAAAHAGNEPALRNWLIHPSSWWTQDFSTQHKINRAQLLASVESIVNTMTSRQRKHFAKRLDKWIKVLNSVLAD